MTKKILILAANPKNTSSIRLDEEIRDIENGLERSHNRDEFVFKPKLAVRSSDVRRAMLDYEPNIVHFCGHGLGEEGIIFEDDFGEAKPVKADALADFFKLFSNHVECVILNACYSEVQAKAISEHIAYVIGMKNPIKDATAIEFSVAFYDALGAGKPIEFAYDLARNAIQLAGLPEYLTPILIKGAGLPYFTDSKTSANLEKLDNINQELALNKRARLLSLLDIGYYGSNMSFYAIELSGIDYNEFLAVINTIEICASTLFAPQDCSELGNLNQNLVEALNLSEEKYVIKQIALVTERKILNLQYKLHDDEIIIFFIGLALASWTRIINKQEEISDQNVIELQRQLQKLPNKKIFPLVTERIKFYQSIKDSLTYVHLPDDIRGIIRQMIYSDY